MPAEDCAWGEWAEDEAGGQRRDCTRKGCPNYQTRAEPTLGPVTLLDATYLAR